MSAASSLALALLLASTVTAQKTTDNTQSTTASSDSASQVSVTSVPNLSSASAAATSSGSSAAGSSISITDAPSITSSSAIGFSLTGSLPTIAGVGPVTQVVPDTSNAPFMQKSSLPEGSVFIIVGAILGFMGLAILAWRGVIAWSLRKYLKRQEAIEQLVEEYEPKQGSPVEPYNCGSGINSDIDRSVRRAHADYSPDIKEKPHRNGHKSVYGKGGEAPSTLSLDRLPPHRTSSEPQSRLSKSSHGRTPTGANPAAARNSNLFFSPTAGAGNHSMPMPSASPFQHSNRSSTYLPAGYYSSPSAVSPAGGASSTVIGSGTVEIPSRLSHLNPLNSTARAGYTPQRNFGPSPPGSPVLPPARKSGEDLRRYGDGAWSASPLSAAGASSTVGNIGGRGSLHQQSSSTVNLSVPGGALNGGRAPSANLEDLFENHGSGPRERF